MFSYVLGMEMPPKDHLMNQATRDLPKLVEQLSGEIIVKKPLPAAENLQLQLSQWAIQELVEKSHYEEYKKNKQKKQKWLTILAGAITTLTPIVVLISESFNEADECPTCPVCSVCTTYFNSTL